MPTSLSDVSCTVEYPAMTVQLYMLYGYLGHINLLRGGMN